MGRAAQAILFSVISYFMLQFDMEAGGLRAPSGACAAIAATAG